MYHANEATRSLQVALSHARRLLEGQAHLALEQSIEILKVVPQSPDARLIMGTAQRHLGDAALAVATLTSLAISQPRSSATAFQLGMAHADCGDCEAALAAYRHATELKPDFADAWRAMADLLLATGNGADADEAYCRQILAATHDPRLLAPACALLEGRIAQAEPMLRNHLKSFPTDVAALRMLAEIAARLGRHADAELLLERCMELAPSFHAARFHYALVLQRQNKVPEALRHLVELERVDGKNSAYQNLRAVTLLKIGEYAQSIEAYAEVLAACPDDAKIRMSYAHALATAGREADCIAAYRESIRLSPSLGEAYWSLANLKTFRFTDAEVEAMAMQLRRSDLDEEDRFHFEFARGKALEDCRDYSASFRSYTRANAIRRSRLHYDAKDTTSFVEQSKRIFTAEFFANREGWGFDAPDPIFIVGLPRAGSTLIDQMIASHSSVEGTMELHDIIMMTGELSGTAATPASQKYLAAIENLSREEVHRFGKDYIERTRIQRKSDKPYFIDKMPNNFLHAGLIHLALPNAKIIDARRHPVACCFSGFKQHFAQGQRFSYSLTDIAEYYRDYVELMKHFDRVLPGRIYRVIYERLVEDTAIEVRRLLAFCGLRFEDECLRFYENKRPVRTASAQQVRQPIYKSGIDQWRHFEQWLDPLKKELGSLITAYSEVPV